MQICHKNKRTDAATNLNTVVVENLQEPEIEHDITVGDDSDDSSIDDDILCDEEPSSAGKEVSRRIPASSGDTKSAQNNNQQSINCEETQS